MRDIGKQEEAVLRGWKRGDVFAKSVAQRVGKPRFVFYDGPPTANGRPGIHHAMILSMKDAFLRYKTMRGFLVERRAGWDTHGLPVELEVEKQLGFSGKADIEKYGIAKFNAQAKKSVWTYKKEWEQLQERLGFWIDRSHPYVTYENDYIESVWWALSQAHEKGLLEEDFKVVPYCPRCGTALASHEVAQGYQTVHDRSLYVKFHVRGEGNVALLAWTTTPWTLPGNVALAVGADITYAEVFVEEEGTTYIVAKDAVSRLFAEGAYTIRGELPGRKLAGLKYDPLFNIAETQNTQSHKVYVADFVNTEDGTGIVHTAVMYGEDDYRLGEQHGLPKVHTVNESGHFNDFVPEGLAGQFVKDEKTEQRILAVLGNKGLVFKEERYKHEYPFCWRCKTPLLYYARASWYIRMSRLRDQLLAANETINWVPEHLKEGRFGEWLREIKDWAVSRERYWGTPLPIWRCDKDPTHIEIMGSVSQLASRIGFRNRYLLVRHGESENNVRHLLSSDTDAEYPLTDKGREQATATAAKLVGENVDVVITSDLMRAHQTAGIIGQALGLEPETDERLREINLGEFEGQPYEEYRVHMEKDATTAYTQKPKKGESWSDVETRVLKLIAALEKKYQGKTIALVSHSGPAWILEVATTGAPRGRAFKEDEPPLLGNAEMRELTGGMLPRDKTGALDLHRPYVDSITFPCAACAAIGEDQRRVPSEVEGSDQRQSATSMMHRVSEVADVWLDSASMPFAQWHYPFEHKGLVETEWYPADFILEAIDQTRGWFYTLLATATFLGWEAPYRNVVSTGHVLDKHGKKMSKSRGNAVDPWEMFTQYGADTVRWYFATVNQPADPKRFDERDMKTAMNRFVDTFANTFTFWNTYATRAAWKKLDGALPKPETLLDKWILSRLQGVTAAVRERMDAYDLTTATRTIEAFVLSDLSNWYVRRSRERFQRPESPADKLTASQVLGYVLVQTAKLSAPFTPFLSETVYQGVTKGESVHLLDYPEVHESSHDHELEAGMAQVRQVIADGLAIRKANKIAVRQPLAAIAVANILVREESLAELIKDELNVKDVVPLDVGKHEMWLTLPDVAEGSEKDIRLDPKITEELRIEGNVRNLSRAYQEKRKEAGLSPSDMITLYVVGPGATTAAFIKEVEREPTALRVKKLETMRGAKKLIAEDEKEFDGERVWIGIEK